MNACFNPTSNWSACMDFFPAFYIYFFWWEGSGYTALQGYRFLRPWLDVFEGKYKYSRKKGEHSDPNETPIDQPLAVKFGNKWAISWEKRSILVWCDLLDFLMRVRNISKGHTIQQASFSFLYQVSKHQRPWRDCTDVHELSLVAHVIIDQLSRAAERLPFHYVTLTSLDR